jgi:hypothetical protein
MLFLLGTFIRVSDAVKGPFFPSPPPFPTSDGKEYENVEDIKLWAPTPDTDPGNMKVPENQLIA